MSFEVLNFFNLISQHIPKGIRVQFEKTNAFLLPAVAVPKSLN